MAERRMFSKKVIDTDLFLDMPATTQNLYFHLCMRADDDGFVDSPNKIMRNTGANKNDMDLLLAKQFIIPFENGICVIKHWRIHNYIRSDRYRETLYKSEKKSLSLVDDIYIKDSEIPIYNKMVDESDTSGIPMCGIGKVRIGEVSKGKDRIINTCDFENEFESIWNEYPKRQGKAKSFEKFKKAIKDGVAVEKIREGIRSYNYYNQQNKTEQQFIKAGSTWFNNKCWDDDYTIVEEARKKKPLNKEERSYQAMAEWLENQKEGEEEE